MEVFFSLEGLSSLLTLTLLEIVLGIDNIAFISIVVQSLPEAEQKRARYVGLLLALIFRIFLLLTLAWIAHITQPLFKIGDFPISARDLVLWGGGLFLIAKSTTEIHNRLEGGETAAEKARAGTAFHVILQIVLLDLVFSVDSVITAIGLVEHIPIMIAAIVIAMVFMIAFSGIIARVLHQHPTLKMLALAFLLLVGVLLFLEGFHIEVPRGYIYFAMAFSLFVEMLNLRLRKVQAAVELHEPYGKLES